MDMDISANTASTLTRPRISIAIISAAAAASIGYFLYRAVYDPPLPELATSPPRGLHRSNAVRRRSRQRRSSGHRSSSQQRRDSADTSSSSSESHGDENADVTIRPLADGETVAEEHMLEEDWWNDPAVTTQHPRAGQNIVTLLFRVSEDNARRNAYVHRGCQCNSCGIAPIRGIRYRCANCADFDLCEICESQGPHIKTHIFYKVRIPAPPFGPRQMQSVWYPGDPETCLRNLPKPLITKLSKDTGFERPELEAFWEQWTFMANTEWREDPDDLCLAMDRKTFERCLVPSGGYRHTAPNLIHDRMFAFYDTNNDDLIGFSEFLHGLSYRKRKEKLRKVFEGYDIDRDGYVNRRDFLRIFRAYYVLYKQMHKDILEGLDDQVMSSTEAQQLVSSRQPLSSLFGREGRVPQADSDRPMEGKIFHENGDVTVSDGKNAVVNEDRPDTSAREAILLSLFNQPVIMGDSQFSPTSEHPQSPGSESDPRYFNGLLNPPTRVEDLPSLLTGESREGDELFVSNGDGEHAENGYAQEGVGLDDENRENPGVSGDGRVVASPHAEPSRENAIPSEAYTDRVPTESRLRARLQRHGQGRAALNRRLRANARRKLLERWKRRQFYLDEEEGATPPDGWDEEDDILHNLDGMPESSKVAQQPAPLSPRSRSSSKVRFAEDTDDYEIRSNPSTSSRSVPERWGGMEIPDAERDAGKEILYQVTQQAFNELLDILFKRKEDLAVRAAETKELREKHRHLFADIDLEGEGEGKEGGEKTEDRKQASSGNESKAVEDRSLQELLLSSGYTVAGEATADENDSNSAWMAVMEEIVGDHVAFENANAGELTGGDPAAAETPASELAEEERRDPTMPQFRPNSWSSEPRQVDVRSYANAYRNANARASANANVNANATTTATATRTSNLSSAFRDGATRGGRQPEISTASREAPAEAEGSQTNTNGEKEGQDVPPPAFPRATLVEWKRLDIAEQEANERGGWGKLSCEEFEEIYKLEESRSNRLDYLGSWIDFCIP